MLEISSQPPSAADMLALLQEANQSPFITGMSGGEIDALVAAGTLRFAYVGGRFMGYAGWMVINERWCEVGPFFLMAHARGSGYGGQLMADVMQKCRARGFHMYGVSKNPAMKRLFERHSFEQVGMLELPLVVYGHLLRRFKFLRALRASRHLSRESLTHYVKSAE